MRSPKHGLPPSDPSVPILAHWLQPRVSKGHVTEIKRTTAHAADPQKEIRVSRGTGTPENVSVFFFVISIFLFGPAGPGSSKSDSPCINMFFYEVWTSGTTRGARQDILVEY